MKPASIFSLLTVPVLLLTFTSCQKSAPVETEKVKTVEAVPSAPAAEVKKEAPVIPAGTWVGTKADNSDAATLAIEVGNRMTILQQDSTTTGTYSVDTSVTPALLTFTPDGPASPTYSSQVQWVDPNTMTMTSFVEASAPATPSAPPVQATGSQPAPFTGNVPPPVTHTTPATTSPVFGSEILVITFRKQ